MSVSTLSITELNYILDKTKTQILLGKQAGFFGSILCSLEFVWTDTVRYAATDGIHIYINTDWWLTLEMDTRVFVLNHELEHIARLHPLRQNGRDIGPWNRACDAVINVFRIRAGDSIVGVEWIINRPEFADMAEEEVYEILLKEGSKDDDFDDMLPPVPSNAPKIMNNVIRAAQQAKIMGKKEDVPGYVEVLVQRFMEPKIQWEVVLREWCTELIQGGTTWSRPSRRHTTMYLPSRDTEADTLDHLMYFFDTSASITDEMVMRFNSEVRYIMETMSPKKLTLVQFDTQIRDVKVFEAGDEFEVTDVHGRGNTSMDCVVKMINETEPTAVIVFSDMECEPMPKPDHDVPIIWVIIDNPDFKPEFGTSIHISG